MGWSGCPGWVTAVPYAHRGLFDPADGPPENSLAAFEAAAVAGYGIELDVHLTADGHLVVTHDDDVERVTGRAVRVAQSSLVQLSALRLNGTDERIPSLTRVLDLVGDRVPVMVEIKNPTTRTGALEAAVATAVAEHRGPVSVASFNPRTVGWFAEHAPGVVRGQTSSQMTDVPAPAMLRWAMRTMRWNRFTRPHYVSYALEALPNRWTDAWRVTGRPLITWTARTPHDLVKAAAVADQVIFEGVIPRS